MLVSALSFHFTFSSLSLEISRASCSAFSLFLSPFCFCVYIFQTVFSIIYAILLSVCQRPLHNTRLRHAYVRPFARRARARGSARGSGYRCACLVRSRSIPCQLMIDIMTVARRSNRAAAERGCAGPSGAATRAAACNCSVRARGCMQSLIEPRRDARDRTHKRTPSSAGPDGAAMQVMKAGLRMGGNE